MKLQQFTRHFWMLIVIAVLVGILLIGCPGKQQMVGTGDAASKVYVPPGEYDEFYAFFSGGFSGQVTAYGLPSGRLFRIIPVFSQNAENAWGYSE